MWNTVFINYFLLVAKFNLFDKQMFYPRHNNTKQHTHTLKKSEIQFRKIKLNKFWKSCF